MQHLDDLGVCVFPANVAYRRGCRTLIGDCKSAIVGSNPTGSSLEVVTNQEFAEVTGTAGECVLPRMLPESSSGAAFQITSPVAWAFCVT